MWSVSKVRELVNNTKTKYRILDSGNWLNAQKFRVWSSVLLISSLRNWTCIFISSSRMSALKLWAEWKLEKKHTLKRHHALKKKYNPMLDNTDKYVINMFIWNPSVKPFRCYLWLESAVPIIYSGSVYPSSCAEDGYIGPVGAPETTL